MDKHIKWKIKATSENNAFMQIKELEEIAKKNNIDFLDVEIELVNIFGQWYEKKEILSEK